MEQTRRKEFEPLDEKKPIAEMHVDTITLVRLLEKVEIDGSISYAELGASIDRDVQVDARGNLTTAKNVVQRESRIVFSPVRGTGLRRLDNEGIVGKSRSGFARTQRACRRDVKVLACAEYDALNEQQQREYNMTLSILGAVKHVSSRKSIKKVEATLSAHALEPTAVQKTLELMR